MSTGRLEAFSDGVFAIAATLLVLDLHVAAPPGKLAHALAHEWPHYATFVVSFLTIGIIWVNHHAQFGRITKVDRPLLFINVLLLMFVALIPFPTGLLADHLHAGSDQHVAAAVYSGSFFLMGICFSLIWLYTSGRGHLLARKLSRRELRLLITRNSLGNGAYLVAFGLAFVSAVACLCICGLAALYYTLPGRLPEGDHELS
jgi:uncharacterized membrane protein